MEILEKRQYLYENITEICENGIKKNFREDINKYMQKNSHKSKRFQEIHVLNLVGDDF